MFDLVFLVLIPLVVSFIIAIVFGIANNIFLKKKSRKIRIYNISTQPRVVHDKNHKNSDIVDLMNPVRDTDFIEDCKDLIKNSICDIIVN